MVRQMISYSLGILLMFMLLIITPAITVLAASTEGVITGSNVNFRSSPSISESKVLLKLQKDEKVTIIEELKDWYKVSANSKVGYVYKELIKVIAKETKPKDGSYETSVIVNGQPLELKFEPPIESGRVLVPFRAISEALDIDVTWNQAMRQVSAVDPSTNKSIVFTINDKNAIVNNQIVELDVTPKIINSHTMLPLRFFSTQFGAKIGWSQETRTATVNRVIKVEEVVEEIIEEEVEETEEVVEEIAEEEVEESEEIVEEVIEEVKSISPPIHLAGLEAVVTSDTLNVRQGPSTTEPIVSKIVKGQLVDVIGSEGGWLKISLVETEGFIHSAYVDLLGGDMKLKGLIQPSFEQYDKRYILSWTKLAGTVLETTVEGNQLKMTSDANLIEEISLVNEAIEKVNYTENEIGTTIDVILREGYTAFAYDTLEKVTITFIKKSIEGKRIVIDAGHGAKDPGAVANGLEEKEIILDVSLRLQKLLEEAGVEVLMTRVDDTFLELGERVEFANAHMADAFVSIHANAATSTTANGTETFWNSTYSSDSSLKLAEEIQAKLLEKLGTTDRGVKHAKFQVIRNSKMPSSLVELGFLTNTSDAELLARDDFRQRSAEAIFEGIMNYYK